MTDIDQALQSDSRTWADHLPEPADLDAHLARLNRGSRMRPAPHRWTAPALAAAAVIVVAVGLAVVARAPWSTRSDSGAPTGPVPTRGGTSAPSVVVVPRLVGLSPAAAVARLRRLGVRSAEWLARASTDPAGKVIDQAPTAGSRLPGTPTVRLTISAGAHPTGGYVSVPGIASCSLTVPARQPCAGGPDMAEVVRAASSVYRLAGGGRFTTATPAQIAQLRTSGALTAEQAIRAFKEVDHDWHPPHTLVRLLGSFTFEHGDTSGHFLRLPSWAIVYPGCALSRAPGGDPTVPAHCDRWLLLDAYTGHMLVASNGPTPR